jgi:4-hydroxy-2-oxoheptanedioate aldolase
MQTFKDLFLRDGPVLGLYMQSADPTVVEFAKAAGFDFIRLDNEHVLYDYAQLKSLIRTAILLDLPCQVRISHLADITKLLDAGAAGIVVPDVNTVDRAREAVAAVKYYPQGSRGIYPLSPPVGRFMRLTGSKDFAEYVKLANEYVSLTLQIEDVRTADCLDEILSLPGVDMVSSGKGDISQSLGMPGQTTAPEVLEFEQLLVRKALEYRKRPVLLANTKKNIEDLMRLGVRIFTCGPDELIFARSLQSFVKDLKE